MTINSTIPYWTPNSPAVTNGHLREYLAVLGNRRQRAILDILIQCGQSLSRAELVRRLVGSNSAMAGSASEASVAISLTHVDLPRLAAAQFIATHRASSTVRLLEHPLLADPHVKRLLAGDETWDDRIRVMAVERHRLICAVVADHPGPLPRDQLAALVAAHESPRVTHQHPSLPPTDTRSTHPVTPAPSPPSSSSVSPSSLPAPTPPLAPVAVESISRALHHVHLPTLAAAGLVVYDPEAGTVVSNGSDSASVWNPPTSAALSETQPYPVECKAAGVGIRLVVSPDGHVDDAYAYTTDESTIRTVAVPIRTPMTDNSQQPKTVPTDEPLEATATTSHREQWLIDCWLRHNTAS